MDEQEYYSNIRRRLIRMRNDVVKGKFVWNSPLKGIVRSTYPL